MQPLVACLVLLVVLINCSLSARLRFRDDADSEDQSIAAFFFFFLKSKLV